LFSNIDRFPPLGTHWQIWPDDPVTSRQFRYRVYYTDFDYVTFEDTISKVPNQTWLVFNEELSYSPTAPAIPVPAAVWLFGSGLLGLVGIARRRRTPPPAGARARQHAPGRHGTPGKRLRIENVV
jgi:hypothetical protein